MGRPRKVVDPQVVIDAQAEVSRLKKLLAARSLPDDALSQNGKNLVKRTSMGAPPLPPPNPSLMGSTFGRSYPAPKITRKPR